jgi:CrcB protein
VILFAVALGGVVGAPARYLSDRSIGARTASDFPFGTVLVNLAGSLLLGLLTGLELHGHLGGFLDALLAPGFCGAFTTFSTWSFETIRLVEEGEYAKALANAFGSLALGLAAGAAGLAAGLAS